MNYKHVFHAGNFADVFKHVVLIELLACMKAKPAPFCFMDTHAGRGLYDLAGVEARRSGETDAGIDRLLRDSVPPATLRPYLDTIAAFETAAGKPCHYPGSPLIALHHLRNTDDAILTELQRDEATTLKHHVARFANAHVHQRDGYEAMQALLPPAEKRGLVLIDPPYEVREAEFGPIRKTVTHAAEHWPGGRFVVWYPIKLDAAVNPFRRWLKQAFGDKVLIAELLIQPPMSEHRLNGCGMAMIRPPWPVQESLAAPLDALGKLLANDNSDAIRLYTP